MAKLDFQLNEFMQGYFVCMTVTTQCANTLTVKLQNGSTVLLTANKTDGSSALKVVAQNSVTLTAAGPVLTVEVPNAARLEQSRVAGLISDNKARRVGFVYDFCIEIGDNEKMDDIYVNIVGWAKKG